MSKTIKMNKSIISITLIGLVLFVIFNLNLYKNQLNPIDAEYEEASVISVIDGDTVIVKIYGDQKKVRLIGINSPELEEDYGQDAKEYLIKLIENKKLYLTKDVSEKDQYDRLLRYIWIHEISHKQTLQKEFVMLNLRILEDGYAKVMTVEPDSMYTVLFESAEREAKKQKKGLWESVGY